MVMMTSASDSRRKRPFAATFVAATTTAALLLAAVAAASASVSASASASAELSRKCEDSKLRFFHNATASRMSCSDAKAAAMCATNAAVSHMCPATCGRCGVGAAAADSLPCEDAPSSVRFGRTKRGADKTCAYLARVTAGRACTDGPEISWLVDAVCPRTCGKCDGGAGGVFRGDGLAHRPAQIMLYWERNFLWQETTVKRSWCMECSRNCSWRGRARVRRGACRYGDYLTIAKCNAASQRQWWVWDGGFIQPHTDRALCVEYGHSGTYYRLSKCDKSYYSPQKFRTNTGFNTDGNYRSNAFELYPDLTENRCVTQEHHPRCGELLYHVPCEIPRSDRTSYWIADGPPNLCGHNLDGKC